MATSVDAKLLKSTKFPVEFNQKVDMQKVNVEVMKKWIAGKISEILGNEDDVVIELCFNLIEGARFPDIKKMQIQLTGFLDKDTASFCKELWKLCLSAQGNPQGVPKELLEAKKLELIQEKIQAEKSAEEARLRREDEERRDRELNTIRNRERGERGRGGRGGDSWRGSRGNDRNRDFVRDVGRGSDRRVPRYSRSPPPRRRYSRDRDSFQDPLPREADTYVPTRRRFDHRRRSPSPRSASPAAARSPSNSRSPHHRRTRSSSRSRSPPHRRRSRSPGRRGAYGGGVGRGRGRSPDRGTRRRSLAPSDASLSRSPRRSRRRRSTSTSISPSPPPRSRRSHRRDSSSRSRSLSSSRSLNRSPHRRVSRSRERDATSAAAEDDADLTETRSRARRSHERDERRLTRSNSRSSSPRRRRSKSPSSGGRERKRRRSMQRYEPANKRRRNTSSVSSPIETRNKKADTEDESDRGSPRREIEANKRAEESNEIKYPERQASELREKLLRDKIKKMRTSSIDSMDA